MFFFVACGKDAPIGITPYNYNLPSHFPQPKINANNILSIQGVALGRLLFYDANLSKQKNISCATCHLPKYAFADTATLSIGNNNLLAQRNTPALFNLAFLDNYFWDGGVPNLESTSLVPLIGANEMANNIDTILVYLNNSKNYKTQFQKIYGVQKINTAMLLNVLAQFQNTLISSNSKYDKFIQNQYTFTNLENMGFEIFNNPQKGNCNTCHTLENLSTDNNFHNIGLDSQITDVGRYRITLQNADSGKFRTPTLRNLSYTFPYMHNGKFKTIKQVLEFYNAGFVTNNLVDTNITKFAKNRLSIAEINALEAFLKTLDDEEFINDKRYSKP